MTQKLMELSSESFTEFRTNILNFCESNYIESCVNADLQIVYEFKLQEYILYITDNALEIQFIKDNMLLMVRRRRE